MINPIHSRHAGSRHDCYDTVNIEYFVLLRKSVKNAPLHTYPSPFHMLSVFNFPMLSSSYDQSPLSAQCNGKFRILNIPKFCTKPIQNQMAFPAFDAIRGFCSHSQNYYYLLPRSIRISESVFYFISTLAMFVWLLSVKYSVCV